MTTTILKTGSRASARPQSDSHNRAALLKQALRSQIAGDILVRLLLARAGCWRLARPRRKVRAGFPLPPIRSPADVPAALAHIRECEARGELSRKEARDLVTMMKIMGRALANAGAGHAVVQPAAGAIATRANGAIASQGNATSLNGAAS
jgi:hypothetical protein